MFQYRPIRQVVRGPNKEVLGLTPPLIEQATNYLEEIVRSATNMGQKIIAIRVYMPTDPYRGYVELKVDSTGIGTPSARVELSSEKFMARDEKGVKWNNDIPYKQYNWVIDGQSETVTEYVDREEGLMQLLIEAYNQNNIPQNLEQRFETEKATIDGHAESVLGLLSTLPPEQRRLVQVAKLDDAQVFANIYCSKLLDNDLYDALRQESIKYALGILKSSVLKDIDILREKFKQKNAIIVKWFSFSKLIESTLRQFDIPESTPSETFIDS